MAFFPVEGRVIEQKIADTSTTQKHTLGMIVKAKDSTYGEGEFIYLLGVGSTIVGSLVSWNATTFQTTLVPNTADLGTPVAVAMSANVASQYGWYQIGGLAVIARTAQASAPQVKVFLSGTAGKIMTTSASGKAILGAKSANLATISAAVGLLTVLINRPHTQIRTI